MQSETAKIRPLALLLMSLAILLFGNTALAQQSIEDNVRPVGQVCLAGQACVGSTAGRASAAMPAAATTAAAPVAEEVVAEVVEEVVEEVAAAAEVAAFDVESTYQMSCFACHGTGAAGAPIMGDADVWTERMAKGIDAVMANVINGLNAMPPKGLCMTCSDDNLRALVDYMSSQ
ncbi:MAG: c-type cytochrome [Pseudohongiellaceae bacterium]